ncbi:unnamed protein product [Diamesa hyperborea]
MNRRRLDEMFTNIEQISSSQSHSEPDDDINLSSQNNVNDCNYLLNKRLPDTSIFDEGSLKSNIRRWSLNLNSKNGKIKKPFYHRTIKFMPTKLQKTVSLDGTLLETDHIDQLTQEIEKHDHLMEDNIKSEQLRINTIKSMPQSLSAKRAIRARLSRTINRRSHLSSSHNNNSAIKNIKFYPVYFWQKVCVAYRQTFNYDVWYGSMKDIEGHFGSKICVFFKILRYLVMLNLFVAILTFSFITFPQILYDAFQKEPEIIAINTTNLNQNFELVDLFTADGYLRKSILFYGGYTHNYVKLGSMGSYSIPYAYFLTISILYTVIFIVLSISMARSYRKSFIEATDNTPNLYCHKIFCAWDFGLAYKQAAELKHRNIFRELKDLLFSECKKIEDERLSKMHRFWNVTIQVIAHIFVFAIVISIGLYLWKMFSIYETELNSKTTKSRWKYLYIPLVINSAILFCSNLFAWISKAEEYKFPRTTIHIRLFRNFLLEITIVAVLLGFWMTRYENFDCWETKIGQEVYRILITDFFIHTLGTCLYYFIRFLIHKYNPEAFDLPEFDITHSSLGLVFNQFLFWVGLLFSPFLAFVIVIKMILIFYIMKLTLIKCCKAPLKLWKNKQTQTFFLAGIFTTLLCVFVTHGFIIITIPVSKDCGPFRNYGVIFTILMEGILKLKEGHIFWKIVTSLTKPGVVGGILLTFCVIVYYLRAKANAQISRVKLLKQMLYMEAKDKEFLLGNISRLAQGKELSFNLNDDEELIMQEPEIPIDGFAESNETWKYENNLARNLRLDFEHIPTTSGYTSAF